MFSRILVTGGAGFVGSNLSIRLKSEFPGSSITALDNLHRRGSELNLPRLARAGVQFVHGDIRRPEDFKALAAAPDLIIECSAEPSAQAGYGGSPEYLIQTNLNGAFHCLELARVARSAFLFLSTSRVYPYATLNRLNCTETETRFVLTDDQPVAGASSRGISEAFPLEGARSLYGMTKLAAELMVEEYADAYGLPAIITRFGLLTGPWQMAKADQGVVALWAARHHFKLPLSYIGFGGTGKQVRDFLHIDDFCDLVCDQIRHFPDYQGRKHNAGGGLARSLSLVELTALCEEITGNRLDIKVEPDNRPADVRAFITDHSAISSVRGWRPKRDARQTLTDIVGWLRENEQILRPLL